jgi:hypothetical protein
VSAVAAPTLLETRYRRVLRVLPADYRAVWEEDMVGSLLDARGVDGSDTDAAVLAGLGTPGPAELLSVVGLAVRVRLGAFGATPRQVLWGEGIRRFALVGLLVAAAVTLSGAVWDPVVEHTRPGGLFPAYTQGWLVVGPWRALLGAAGLLWLPAFLALVAGRRRTATALAVGALVPDLVGATLSVRDFPAAIATSLAVLVVQAAPVLCLVAFHDAAPPVRPRPWLVALGAAAAFLLLPPALRPALPSDGTVPAPRWLDLLLLDWVGLCAVAATAATVVHLVARRRGRRFGSHGWTLALGLTAASALLQRLASWAEVLAHQPADPMLHRYLVAAGVQVVLVAGATVVLATLVREELPRTHDGPAPVQGAGPSVAG